MSVSFWVFSLVLNELKIKYTWKGKDIYSRCYDQKKNCIIECDKKYFRPLEVDTLLGDSRKARKELKWKPKITFEELVSEMIENDVKEASIENFLKQKGFKVSSFNESPPSN